MSFNDPTANPRSLPPRQGAGWSAEEVAQLHQFISGTQQPKSLNSNSKPLMVTDPRPNAISSAHTTQFLPISGLYKSSGRSQLELRIDVDGIRPLSKMSGDFFTLSGSTLLYYGSFVVESPTITISELQIVIEGLGHFSYSTNVSAPWLKVTIERSTVLTGQASASARFFTTSGLPGNVYHCDFVSRYFRHVEYEQDIVGQVEPFTSYDTSLLPSGGQGRVLSVLDSFAECGVQMIRTGGEDRISPSLAGEDGVWTNAELHAAMTNHFSNWRDDMPTWRVWLLAATKHESGDRGIMFDEIGRQRQGCAVFHDVIGGATNDIVRGMLRTYVHELGHCFNLCHSHEKSLMNPPRRNRVDALSWMSIPDEYQSPVGRGANAYWAAFPFQFDDEELSHIRHGYLHKVIMGGEKFAYGSADAESIEFERCMKDDSGLELTIKSKPSHALGEPIVIEIRLKSNNFNSKQVINRLHPKNGFVQIAITKPGGSQILYRSYIRNCSDGQHVTLNKERPAIYDSAYIGYGHDGFYFESTGVYRIRAVYNALDGSKIASNILRIRVRAPHDDRDEELADLYLGEDQGKLLYLLGSDSPDLESGRNAFRRVLEKYDKHPLALYANLALGLNASREFKQIDGRTISVRNPQVEEGAKMLTQVVQVSTCRKKQELDRTRLDNITLDMVMQQLASLYNDAGEDDKAAGVAKASAMYFRKLKVPKYVMQSISDRMLRTINQPQPDGPVAVT